MGSNLRICVVNKVSVLYLAILYSAYCTHLYKSILQVPRESDKFGSDQSLENFCRLEEFYRQRGGVLHTVLQTGEE